MPSFLQTQSVTQQMHLVICSPFVCQVQNQSGTWFERVRSMRILQKAGQLSAEEVGDEARLLGLDSTRLMVAGSVRIAPSVLRCRAPSSGFIGLERLAFMPDQWFWLARDSMIV